MNDAWRALAAAQSGLLARPSAHRTGCHSSPGQAPLRSERWQHLSATVVATTTGPLSSEQRQWFAALHCGGDALIGGLSAAERHGLRGWERETVCVLVDDELKFDPVAGLDVVRTRRCLVDFRDPRSELPLCRREPAVLLYAGYTRSSGPLSDCWPRACSNA